MHRQHDEIKDENVENEQALRQYKDNDRDKSKSKSKDEDGDRDKDGDKGKMIPLAYACHILSCPKCANSSRQEEKRQRQRH